VKVPDFALPNSAYRRLLTASGRLAATRIGRWQKVRGALSSRPNIHLPICLAVCAANHGISACL